MMYRLKIQSVKAWSAIDYSLATFIACTSALYIAGFLAMAGFRQAPLTYLVLLLLCCLTALVYLSNYWKISNIVTKYGGVLKASIGIISVGVATVSKIYSDAGISELTGLAPQDLPAAQLLLTFMLAPTIWLISLSLLFGYLSLPVMLSLLVRSLVKDIQKKSDGANRPSNLPDVTALMAVALFVIIMLTMTQTIASKNFYEPRLRKAIAFSSFHLPTSYCGLLENKDFSIAPMSDDRAAIAIPDVKLGYKFELIACKPIEKETSEINAIMKKVDSEMKKN